MKRTAWKVILGAVGWMAALSGQESGVAFAQCPVAAFTQNSGTAGDQFGNAVAIDGDHMIIGAKFYDEGGTNSGAAFVYRRTNGNWSLLGKLYPPGGPHLGDYFGVSVALSGNRAIVGAMKSDYAGSNAGAAFIYDWIPSLSTWQLAAILVPPQLEFDQGFGFSVDIDGETAVVGAYQDDLGPGAGIDAGSAWVYQRNAAGVWSAGSQLWPNSTSSAASDNFGYSVAIRDGLIAVGAPFQDGVPIGSSPDAGRVYLFGSVGGSYSEIDSFELQDAGDNFGYSIAIDGRMLVVGAPGDDEKGNDAGAVFLFEHDPGVPLGFDVVSVRGKLFASGPQLGERFGCAVAIARDLLAVGICEHDSAGATDGGGIQTFHREGSSDAVNWNPDPVVVPIGTLADDRAGFAVAVHGPRIVVGAPQHDTTLSNAGQAVLLDYTACTGIYTIPKTLPIWSPGTQQFFLNAGVANANRSYFLLGSASGTAPGINIGAAHLPLNIDALTIVMLNSLASVPGFVGSFDATGRATASLPLPALLPISALGIDIDYAALVYSPNHALPKSAIGPWKTSFRQPLLEPPQVVLNLSYPQGTNEIGYGVAPPVDVLGSAFANTQGMPNEIAQITIDYGDPVGPRTNTQRVACTR